ncbi:MAG: Arm DNA-binding domain-containing protein, partial [Pseudomonadota bacterium]
MGKVRVRKETGKLYLDFFYQGVRCREQTALTDTPANRKKVEKLM